MAYSILTDASSLQFAHAGTWCNREDLNLSVPLGETGLQTMRCFSGPTNECDVLFGHPVL